MHTTNTISDQAQLFSVRLYRVVFLGYVSRFCALLIVASFILQPLARVEANEGETVDVSVVTTSESADDAVPVVITEDIPTAPAPEAVVPESSAETNEGEATAVSVSSSTDETATASDTPPSLDDVIDTESTSTEPVVAETVTTDTPVSPESPDDSIESGELTTATDDVSTESDESIIPTQDAATTSSSTPDLTIPVSTVQSDSQIQFNKADCVAVADGSFYCQPKKAAPASTQNGFFALPDSDGDLEIYIQKEGEMTQLTHNVVDDAAPFYDSLSETVVWHRLINDRYQIMSYDLSTGKETQLTDDGVNNMEPNRAGEYIVWQHWNNDNWDIMLFDGKTTELLTTALEHDVAPSIRGSLVVWNKLAYDKTQTIELYDIATGEFTTINDSDGGVLSNPRMVLVYESSFANGDVVTKGYDMLTGEIAELATTPVSVPDEIPPPDSTGETRALIQAKPSQKEETEVIDGSQLKTADPDPNLTPLLSATSTQPSATTTVLVATSSPTLTLDLRTESAEPLLQTNDIVLDTFVATTPIPE